MSGQDACPVDHKAREAWLSQARAAEASKAQTQPQPSACPVDHSAKAQPKSWTQSVSSLFWSSPSAADKPASSPGAPSHPRLETDRVVSTIPRTTGSSSDGCPVEHGASANPANHEIESGPDASGNWVYPSEKMFFDAMKRKGYDARVADMKTVVPIHNAVNERAWQQIKEWEAPYLEQSKYVQSRRKNCYLIRRN